MTVNDILDTLEHLIDCAWRIPMTNGKCAISTDEIQNLVNDIRLTLPKEIKQSKMIVEDRKDILSDAKLEAKNIISDAEKRANKMISENEITKQAQQKASQIISQARTQSKELRKMTNEYVENLLNNMENVISNSAQNLKNAHVEIKKIIKSNNNLK